MKKVRTGIEIFLGRCNNELLENKEALDEIILPLSVLPLRDTLIKSPKNRSEKLLKWLRKDKKRNKQRFGLEDGLLLMLFSKEDRLFSRELDKLMKELLRLFREGESSRCFSSKRDKELLNVRIFSTVQTNNQFINYILNKFKKN